MYAQVAGGGENDDAITPNFLRIFDDDLSLDKVISRWRGNASK